MKTVAFHNLGCKVNSYESDIMQQKFAENGFQIVPFDEKADIYVVNTCTVTNMADRKSRQMLHRAKSMNPDAIVIATGCYVQTSPDAVTSDNSVDIAIGNNQKAAILEILEEFERNGRPGNFSSIIDINHTNEYESMMLSDTEDRTRAFIKIQDGCNQFCSYCLIPYARGRVRSRNMGNILEEVKVLAERGYKEFVLTGIHVSSYGITDPNDLSQNKLADLLEAMATIPGVERIRLGSLEPRVVTDDFVKRIGTLGKLCPHFHLSLQSGCDNTLKRMNRHYSAEEYYEGVCRLRSVFDNPAITTDVIAGFPGETDEDFEASYEFAKKVGFYEMHIFKYSKRKGTVAEKLPNQVQDTLKEERSAKLIALSERLSEEYRSSHTGKIVEVLFEEPMKADGECYYVGFSPEYIKVAVKTEEPLSNEIRKVRITGFLKGETMLGEMI